MKFWGVIRQLSTGSLVSSTAVWIFLVPVIVKFSDYFLNNSSDGSGLFDVFAPYSLVCLYFSALAFFLASLVYFLRCPQLVKMTPSYSHFKLQGMTEYNLSESLEDITYKSASVVINKLKHNIASATPEEIDSSSTISISAAGGYVFSCRCDALPQVFWVVYTFHLAQRKAAQCMALTLYGIGFVLLGSILVTNLFYVAEHGWRLVF